MCRTGEDRTRGLTARACRFPCPTCRPKRRQARPRTRRRTRRATGASRTRRRARKRGDAAVREHLPRVARAMFSDVDQRAFARAPDARERRRRNEEREEHERGRPAARSAENASCRPRTRRARRFGRARVREPRRRPPPRRAPRLRRAVRSRARSEVRCRARRSSRRWYADVGDTSTGKPAASAACADDGADARDGLAAGRVARPRPRRRAAATKPFTRARAREREHVRRARPSRQSRRRARRPSCTRRRRAALRPASSSICGRTSPRFLRAKDQHAIAGSPCARQRARDLFADEDLGNEIRANAEMRQPLRRLAADRGNFDAGRVRPRRRPERAQAFEERVDAVARRERRPRRTRESSDRADARRERSSGGPISIVGAMTGSAPRAASARRSLRPDAPRA